MTPEEILRTKLTPEEQAIVATAIKVRVAQAKGESLTAWLKGAMKSWTVLFNAGTVVALLAAWPELEPHITALIGDHAAGKVAVVVAIINILLRAKTTVPLNQR